MNRIGLFLVLWMNPLLLVASEHHEVVSSLIEQVLLPDSKMAFENSNQLSKCLSQAEQTKKVKELYLCRTLFGDLVSSWKAVEALYIVDHFDEDLVDHPHMIDSYHRGNEKIPPQIDRILSGTAGVRKALFKNSLKSFHALEYMLFGRGKSDDQLKWLLSYDKRSWKILQVMVEHLNSHLQEIFQGYLAGRKSLCTPKEALENLVNRLIDSSYRLFAWRLEEATGFGGKFKGKPSHKRFEYSLSHFSLKAIRSIIAAHEKVVSSAQHKALSLLVKSDKNSGESWKFIMTRLDELRKVAFDMKDPIEIRSSKEIKPLYEKANQLHVMYYTMLVKTLGVDAHILDADGD